MDYQYIIRIPFIALDDAQAREKAIFIANKIGAVPEQTVIKLQRLVPGNEPEGVKSPALIKQVSDYFEDKNGKTDEKTD